MGVNRRNLLTLMAGAGGALLWAPAPWAQGPPGTHDAYFARLNALLKREGPGRPVMLIDTARMDHNIDAIRRSVGDDKT